ncbi:uncharacterized protein PHACADRAFT_258504 [Phanerochaete carnosa HHB-10118-sp]|uniref:Transcription activator GCR1-like domain-containing protein n=1 Tax=Phanerochaete carnosa (strain HHB-10118-sp) TaxID=650164 RepID=K5VSS4_PHACS|nr:uncharacterized protein PHACADRAFT_258504 [Phanerochaete carnosa HHB-10118-sp]EKM54563.1 hypothetical protein PHACADRAFT_258504 [Phanerochaete carnosa HHB-10118-sp]
MLAPSASLPMPPGPSVLPLSSAAASLPRQAAAVIPVPVTNPVPPTQYMNASQQWLELLSKFPKALLERHQWEWRDNRWLPVYRYQKVDKITDFWTEHADGLNGHLSTRALDEQWGATWRRNEGGLKTEHGRRKKVVLLFSRLMEAKPRWTVHHVVNFVHEHYSQYQSKPNMFPRFLADHGNAGLKEVLAKAGLSYTGC